ncbi:hypothetical protein O6H91_07G118600 [Diphasiastrum complanatum]|uniref:Uncharacterized protein n=2 Tax=Diphasiastrum complanatum TaxID=34168 RepID=A0ACC2D9J8_DIPCM|nr:hypothetical protein O6H91_07G118600 [Diphasiastrum complanatum]
MVKQGPCCHCGITTTPLWRNGPPDKPVLCNACGSRWRTKGTLCNYMPIHSGGSGSTTHESLSCKWLGGTNTYQNLSESCLYKKKEQECGNQELSFLMKENQNVGHNLDLGTYMSNFQVSMRKRGCHSSVPRPLRDAVPSKKRTLRSRYHASQEKLKKKMTTFDELQTSASTCLSKVDMGIERRLNKLFMKELQWSVLDTEAGSILSENMHSVHVKASIDADYKFAAGMLHLPSAGKNLTGVKEDKQVWKKLEGGLVHSKRISIHNKALLENFPYNKRDVLSSSQSPLIFLELKDILNFETFTSLLSDQELKQVMQFVSSVDMANIPNSLKSMFISSQFEGALSNFQQLLSEGMFDCSEMGLSPNVLGHYEQLLVLTDLAATGWMDQCSQLRTHNTRRRSNFQIRNGVKEKVSESFSTGDSFCSAYANYAEVKFPAGWSPLKSRHKTKEGFESCTIPGAGASTSPQHRRVYPEIGDGRYDKAVRSSELSSSDESVDNELMPGAQNHLSSFKSKKSSAYQLQRNLFSGFSYSAIFSEDTEENDSDNDMLVNVPSTMSFQQAVLL